MYNYNKTFLYRSSLKMKSTILLHLFWEISRKTMLFCQFRDNHSYSRWSRNLIVITGVKCLHIYICIEFHVTEIVCVKTLRYRKRLILVAIPAVCLQVHVHVDDTLTVHHPDHCLSLKWQKRTQIMKNMLELTWNKLAPS